MRLVPCLLLASACDTHLAPPVARGDATRTVAVTLEADEACVTPCTFGAKAPGAKAVRYEADGWVLGTSWDPAGFPLPYAFHQVGPREIAAIAVDAWGNEVGRATAEVDVYQPGSITLVGPDACDDPCTFEVDAGPDVLEVVYDADGWRLGSSVDGDGGFPLTYDFSSLGARSITAVAYARGVELGRTTRTIEIRGPDDAATLLTRHDDGVTVLWDQTFGRQDGASPLENVEDAAAGRPAKTSCYGTAPCDTVQLDADLLRGMNALVESYGYRYFVTSIAGASHSAGSLHYDGRAFDIDEIDGVRVYGNTAATRAFMDACWALGAIEVYGPSNDPAGHYDHIHCAW